MGHRTCLAINTKKEEINAFEANNSVPFFWIGLLDIEILKSARKSWEEYDTIFKNGSEEEIEKYTDIYPSPTCLIVERDSFEKNTTKTIEFFKEFYPNSLDLFTDFRNYIQSKFTDKDDYLSIDIIELSHFDSVEKLYTNILSQIKLIINKKNDYNPFFDEKDIVTLGCGFASNDFKEYSVSYQIALKTRKTSKVLKSKPTRNIKKEIFKHITILLICPFFTYLVYIGFLKDGISFWVVFIAITNIGFYWYSIYRLIEINRQ